MRTSLIWLAAFLITAGSAVYQRMTGPTYPLSGKAELSGTSIEYTFDRSHGGTSDASVRITVADSSATGVLMWKRFKTDDELNTVSMRREGSVLIADLPNQPPAGKLQYSVRLSSGSTSITLPAGSPVVIRFKGDVPLAILIIHVAAMFGAMLLSTRTGLEFFNNGTELRSLTYWTVGLLFVGGMVLGPIVQKYAFGAYWTGWPFGTDLTDNKTLVALLAWVAVAFGLRRAARPALWALLAAILTLGVFMIPHSLLGSELDYKAVDARKNLITTVSPLPEQNMLDIDPGKR